MTRSGTTPGYQLLLPTAALHPEERTLPLADLPPDTDIAADPPDAALVTSIKLCGTVLQPILLFARDGGGYTIGDGRRRICAARAAGFATIRAWVLPPGSVDPASIALMGNALRGDNLLSDYGAILHLTGKGADEKNIRRAAGLSAAAYKARLRFDTLIPEFKHLIRIRSKAVRSKVLQEVSKLAPEQQRGLWDTYLATGALTADDVHAARRVRHEGAAAALPDTLFDTPAAAAPPSWHTAVRLLLAQAHDATPPSAPELRAAIAAALATLAGAGTDPHPGAPSRAEAAR